MATPSDRIAAIITLLQRCSPPTVLRRIVPVIVYAINRVSRRWLRTYVFHEILERMSPSFTYSDTSPTPRFKVGSAWVVASSFHAKPASIFTRLAQAVFDWRPVFSAPTTTSSPTSDIGSAGDDSVATIAKTCPKRQSTVRSRPIRRSRQNNQFTEAQPGHVDCMRDAITVGELPKAISHAM